MPCLSGGISTSSVREILQTRTLPEPSSINRVSAAIAGRSCIVVASNFVTATLATFPTKTRYFSRKAFVFVLRSLPVWVFPIPFCSSLSFHDKKSILNSKGSAPSTTLVTAVLFGYFFFLTKPRAFLIASVRSLSVALRPTHTQIPFNP